jgi:hypothetical protein
VVVEKEQLAAHRGLLERVVLVAAEMALKVLRLGAPEQ